MKKRIIIFRHGPTKENELGIIQGQSVEGDLIIKAIDSKKISWFRKHILLPAVIVSGTKKRCKETAGFLFDELGISEIKTSFLLNQRGWGDVEGMSVKELGNKFVVDAFSADNDKLASGAESLRRVQERVRDVWQYLKEIDAKTIIVITHDEFSNYLINKVMGEGLFRRPLEFNKVHMVDWLENEVTQTKLHIGISSIPIKHNVFLRPDEPIFADAFNGLGSRILCNRGIQMVNDATKIDPKMIEGIIIGIEPFTNEDLRQYPNLKVVARFGRGVDNIHIKPTKGLYVTNTPGCNERSVAEFTVGLITILVAKLLTRRISNRGGGQRILASEWSQIRVGVLGLGAVGKEVAQILKTMGFSVIVWTSHPEKHTDFIKQTGFRIAKSVDEVCSLSDIITVHIRSAKETKNLIGLEQLHLMESRKAYVINTSRFEVIDHKALKTAFDNGWISGVALDVWPEQPVKDEWFKQLKYDERIIATPHIASWTEAAFLKSVSLCAYNIFWVLSGQPWRASCVYPEELPNV